MTFLIKPVILFLILFSGNYQDIEKERWIVEESSELRVKGSSNINQFTCSIESVKRKDTLTIDYNANSRYITFLKNEVLINANAFDCQNPMITADLKKTLKTEKYPNISLRFISLERPTFKNFASQKVEGQIEILIAGKSKKYPITYHMTPRTDGTIYLKGTKVLNFKDFNLSTPSKLLGMIKVNEELEVDFNMVLRPLL